MPGFCCLRCVVSGARLRAATPAKKAFRAQHLPYAVSALEQRRGACLESDAAALAEAGCHGVQRVSGDRDASAADWPIRAQPTVHDARAADRGRRRVLDGRLNVRAEARHAGESVRLSLLGRLLPGFLHPNRTWLSPSPLCESQCTRGMDVRKHAGGPLVSRSGP